MRIIVLIACILAAGLALAGAWPQWRGPGRDGLSPDVPVKMPAKQLVWRKPMAGETHGGIVTDGTYVIVPDHGQGKDYFHCFTNDGKLVWKHEYNNEGEMEYGAAPRAAPLIANGRVYTLGAFGDLFCLELKDGNVVWQRNLAKDFNAEVPQYGYCSSPLIVDGKLIVNPGGEKAAIVALDPADGKVIWETPGTTSAYATFLSGPFGGKLQVIGYDKDSLGGWDVATGKRLWTIVPENTSDFNVSSPVNVNGKLLVATDANFARLYDFKAEGVINPKPVAVSMDFGPDMATPIFSNGMIFGSAYALVCLDPNKGLKEMWRNDKAAELCAYSTIIAGNNRLMVISESGLLFLIAVDATKCVSLGRMQLCEKTWSPPALANSLLFIRDEKWVYCYKMK